MHYEMLTGTRRDAIISPLLHEWLGPLGLTEMEPRRWVDGSKPPARRMFELILMKGACLEASWGFSLDFVPHIGACNIRWHRSDKTARLDVFVNPAAFPEPSFLHGPEQFRDELAALLPRAVAAARRDWERGSTYEGMLQIIREIRDHNTNRLPYDCTPLPWAFIFLAAKTGHLDEAEQELKTMLDRYLNCGGISEKAAARMRKLVREAAAD